MLTKKDKKKRYNKKTRSLTGHEFGMGTKSLEVAKNAFSGSNLGGSLSSVVGGIGGIAEAGIANAQIADTTEQEQEREARKNWQSSASDNDSLLAEMASDVSINENTNWKSIRGVTTGQMVGNTLKGVVSGAGAGAQVGGPWGAVAGAVVGLGSAIAGIFTGNSKAKKKAAELNEAAKRVNLVKAQTLTAKAGALDQAADDVAQRAFAAYGGGINTPKFPNFPSEVTEFNAGGSHEENPYDGIPQGIAPDGLPNLVEEGEVKYDNYIFSDRLMLNKNDKKKYKFLKGKTYADAAKAIKRELGIDERPNDLIAKADLEEHLNILSMLQEEERTKRGLRGENRMMYAKGGHLFEGTENTNNGFYLFDTAEEAAKAGLDYLPPSIDGVLDGISTDNSALKKLNKFDYSIFGAKPDEGINKGLKFTELDLSTDRPGYISKKSKTTKSSNWGSSLLESAPTIASSVSGLVQSFQGHDRSIANKLYNYKPERSYTKAPQVTTPKVNISKYKIDEEQAARENDAMILATMRAARESSTNPLAVMPQIHAASYAGQIARGKARADARKANFDIEMAGNQFNLGIDQLQGNFNLTADKLNAAERDTYNKLKYQALATGASADIRSKESYEDALGKTWTGAAENMNTLAHDKIYDEMVAEYLKNKNAALGGPLSIQKSKNKVRGKKRNRLV